MHSCAVICCAYRDMISATTEEQNECVSATTEEQNEEHNTYESPAIHSRPNNSRYTSVHSTAHI
jgi:hypothetical protein